MDFPFFQADFFGNRLVIAINAIIHVLITHSFAVGMFPLIVLVEWWAYRNDRPDWDELAYKILFVCFIVMTSIGALTGVGIWFTTSVVGPFAIGSLIRVFYFAWFTEWGFFTTELALLLLYFLLWKRMRGPRKLAHIRIGIALSVASWFTLSIVTGILGFMMDPGNWLYDVRFWSGFFNRTFVPQMMFRTAIAPAIAGSLALALAHAFTKKGTALRVQATRVFSGWTLFWLLPTVIWGLIYYRAIPVAMHGNLPVAMGTLAYAKEFGTLVRITVGAIAVVALASLWGVLQPRRATLVAWMVPVVLLAGLLSYFERARQFVRKPYVIGYYMYSNGIRVPDVPYLLKTGLLANSAWTLTKEVTEQNKIDAGRDVYMLTCSRCHTIDGVNSVRRRLASLYPHEQWQASSIEQFLENIHGAGPYMPPFVGTVAERGALAAYLASLYDRTEFIPYSPPGFRGKGE